MGDEQPENTHQHLRKTSSFFYDSNVSDYNIVKKTPYVKDVLNLLADEYYEFDLMMLLLPRN